MADNTTGTELGIIQIESKNLKNIDNFLKGDKNITRIGCPFPYVTSAVSAFENCSNLESFKGDLNSLTDGTKMFYGCEKLETFTGKLPKLSIGRGMFYHTNLSEFTEDLPSLQNGNNMFYHTNLSEFTKDLPSLQDGSNMFEDCKTLKTFKSDLHSLTTYTYMFNYVNLLEVFEGNEIKTTETGSNFMANSKLSLSKATLRDFYCNLPNMTNTDSMFKDYTALKSFKGDLNSLTDGTKMFSSCVKLETFTGKLPKLSIGRGMFYETNLPEFTEDLSSLTDGGWDVNGSSTPGMFSHCKNLKKFDSNLKSLTNYTNMFDNTKLNTFKAVEINVTDTGSDFMLKSSLVQSRDTLTEFNCHLSKMTNTDNMFKGYTALQYCTSYLPDATTSRYMFAYCYSYNAASGITTGLQSFICNLIGSNDCHSMFRGCRELSSVEAQTKNLQIGQNMFRDCSKLNENNFHLDTDNYQTNFYNTLLNGIAMFQGTSFTKIPDTWNFESLEIANQMFQHTQIGANGETVFIDMPNQFPKVKVYKEGETYKYGEKPGPTPVAYMFGSCPIKSINFDVSSVDNGMSMFNNCTQLTQCTGAKFQEGGSYQSMFTESKFDQESAQLIFNQAKLANVANLHIGIGFQLTEDHNFVKNNSLMKYSQDNSGRQWCEGYAYCHCHNTNEEAAREYLQQHGVTKHCHGDTATTYYLENASIMFVCNPN